MGLNVRLEKLTADEIRQFAAIDATSDEGRRLRDRAAAIESQMASAEQGRWAGLTWFTQRERIMSKLELAKALARRDKSP